MPSKILWAAVKECECFLYIGFALQMNLCSQHTHGAWKTMRARGPFRGIVRDGNSHPFSAHFSLRVLQRLQNLWGHQMGGCQAAQSLLQLKYIEFQFHSAYSRPVESNFASTMNKRFLLWEMLQPTVSTYFDKISGLVSGLCPALCCLVISADKELGVEMYYCTHTELICS